MFTFSGDDRVVLLGATGAVGHPLGAELAARGAQVVPVSRRGPGGVDVGRHPERIAELTRNAALTINATGLELPEVARHSRAPFLDISASAPYLLALAADTGAGRVLNVGLAPGLTTMLAQEVAGGPDDRIDVGIVLGVGEHHGPAARDWTARMLGARFFSPADGIEIRAFSRPAVLPLPRFGRRRLHRADFPDGAFPGLIPGRVRSHLGVSSRAGTLALALGTRVPRLAGPLLSTPLPGSHDWALVAVGADSRRAGATGTGQSVATARLTALTAAAAVRAGVRGTVVHQADLLDLSDVDRLPGITLHRATGRRLSGV